MSKEEEDLEKGLDPLSIPYYGFMAGQLGQLPPMENMPQPMFNIGDSSTNSDYVHVHDEFMQFVQESGIGTIAKDVGIVENGGIPALREYAAPTLPIGATSNESNEAEQRKSPVVTRSVKRRRSIESEEYEEQTPEESNGKKKKRGGRGSNEKLNKGLRHFSLKVCQKVEKKKHTTYNEVADELVAEFNQSENIESPVDQKNIRRRVYDALNVLMAMGIISKEKKEIRWIGLPTNAKQEKEQLENEKAERMERIKEKKIHLEELTMQVKAYQNLVNRNTQAENVTPESRINLPFIIVNTKSNTVIECEVSDDRTAYFFNFSLPFEIHDDTEILRRMGMM